MSYFRHVENCNSFRPKDFLPLCFDGRRIGLVKRSNVHAFAARPDLFEVGTAGIEIASGLAGRDRVTRALGEFVESLVEQGLVPELRDEPFAVAERWGAAVLFDLDRSAVPFFGTRSYGVHMNGFVGGSTDALWVGKRAKNKRVAPGKLDNIVAGGIAAGFDAPETLVKEAAEEAAIPAELVARARPCGAVAYRMDVPEGLRDDVLFVYDLAVPEAFQPRNTDGEFESFRVMPLEEVLQLVAETDEFKFNVNLVLIDLAIRKGAIGPEHPEYLALLAGLRHGLSGEAREDPHLLG